MLSISTSFWVLHTPESFLAVFNLFYWFKVFSVKKSEKLCFRLLLKAGWLAEGGPRFLLIFSFFGNFSYKATALAVTLQLLIIWNKYLITLANEFPNTYWKCFTNLKSSIYQKRFEALCSLGKMKKNVWWQAIVSDSQILVDTQKLGNPSKQSFAVWNTQLLSLVIKCLDFKDIAQWKLW